MNVTCRDDLRAVSAFVLLAFVSSFYALPVLAADTDEVRVPQAVVPSATVPPGSDSQAPTGVAAAGDSAAERPSPQDDSAPPTTPSPYGTQLVYPTVVSAFFDEGDRGLVMVQFPVEHARLLFGKGLPRDADAFTALLAENDVRFAVTHIPPGAPPGSLGRASAHMAAMASVWAKDALPAPSPDCLLEESTWSRCYKGNLDFVPWYEAKYSFDDADLSGVPPKLWKWRSLSPHTHTGFKP